jgi:hypothetical protein
VRGRPLLLAFGAWTLFVWATRVGTAFEQDDLSGLERVGRVGLAVSFTLLGLAVVAVWWRARHWSPLSRGQVLLVRVAAAWTVGVWLVRGFQIALADHEAAFIVVHLVLAVVSVALAVAAASTTTLRDRHGTAGHRRAEVDVTS